MSSLQNARLFVYYSLIRWGPSFLTASGSLMGWTCVLQLHRITALTLVYNGEFDTSHDVATVPFFDHIPRVRWKTIAGGGRMCHLEEHGRKEAVLQLVGDFLRQAD